MEAANTILTSYRLHESPIQIALLVSNKAKGQISKRVFQENKA